MSHLVTPNAVLSFPHLFVPAPRIKGDPNAELVYSCTLLFNAEARKTPEWKAIEQALIDTARAFHGEKFNLKNLAEWPLRDGAQKEYAGYGPGIVYIAATSKQRPGVVNRRNQKIEKDDEDVNDLVYAGAIVRASLSPYGWNYSNSKRGVSLGLNHIQIVDATGPRLDGRVPLDKAFPALDELEDNDIPF